MQIERVQPLAHAHAFLRWLSIQRRQQRLQQRGVPVALQLVNWVCKALSYHLQGEK